MTLFRRNNDVIIALCVRWDRTTLPLRPRLHYIKHTVHWLYCSGCWFHLGSAYLHIFTYLTEVRKRIFASWLRVIITSGNGLLQIWYRGIIQNSADLLIGISGTRVGVAWIKIQNRSWKCVRERRINNSEIVALLFRPLISGIRQHESFLRIGFSKSIQMSISSSLITWN